MKLCLWVAPDDDVVVVLDFIRSSCHVTAIASSGR